MVLIIEKIGKNQELRDGKILMFFYVFDVILEISKIFLIFKGGQNTAPIGYLRRYATTMRSYHSPSRQT